MYFKRTGQNMDTYSMEFDMLHQQAEARMLMGSGIPDEFAPVLCMQNGALSKNGKTSAEASTHNTLAFPEELPGCVVYLDHAATLPAKMSP